MTFFANSGARFPNLEKPTRDAGRQALGAASMLWRLFAILEGDARGDKPSGEAGELIKKCVGELRQAADVYQDIVNEVSDEPISPLTQPEIELAHLIFANDPESYRYFDGYFDRFRYRFNLKELYRELMQRIVMLADALQRFDPYRDREASAEPVFAMMRQWEILTSLARVISVVNRRSGKE